MVDAGHAQRIQVRANISSSCAQKIPSDPKGKQTLNKHSILNRSKNAHWKMCLLVRIWCLVFSIKM